MSLTILKREFSEENNRAQVLHQEKQNKAVKINTLEVEDIEHNK